MSELDFRVLEAPVSAAVGGKAVSLPNHKSLIREDTGEPLAVVGKSYKVVQNGELFGEIDTQIMSALGWPACKVEDQVSHQGALCYRGYVFPEIKVTLRGKSESEVAFQIMVQNSFGKTAIRVYVCAIDFFCTNGMILGKFIQRYWRHSARLQIGDVTQPVQDAVKLFHSQAEAWQTWQMQRVSGDAAEQCLKELGIPESLSRRLMDQFKVESKERGENLWALYSAFTYYASHDSEVFPVRQTNSDHTPATLMRRAEQVRRWVESDAFLKLAA